MRLTILCNGRLSSRSEKQSEIMVKTAMINLVHPRPTSFSKACSIGTSGSKPVGLEYFQQREKRENFQTLAFIRRAGLGGDSSSRKCIIRCVKCNRAIVVFLEYMDAEPQCHAKRKCIQNSTNGYDYTKFNKSR